MKLEQKEILRKKRILEYAEACGNVVRACRHFGMSRSNFYIWRTAYRLHGDAGPVRKKPCPSSRFLRQRAALFKGGSGSSG